MRKSWRARNIFQVILGEFFLKIRLVHHVKQAIKL